MKSITLIFAFIIPLTLCFSVYAQEGWWNAGRGNFPTESSKQGDKTDATANTPTNTKPAISRSKSRASILAQVREQEAAQIAAGLKEILIIGARNSLDKLGKEGGFSNDINVRIALPLPLARLNTVYSVFGMGGATSDLEDRMNRAAEIVVPQTESLFARAIQNMVVTDTQAILQGDKDSVTLNLRDAMVPNMAGALQPVIQKALLESGAIQSYKTAVDQYDRVPLAGSLEIDITEYMADKIMAGIFYYIAQEEAAIRTQPMRRTTDNLRKAFGDERR